MREFVTSISSNNASWSALADVLEHDDIDLKTLVAGAMTSLESAENFFVGMKWSTRKVKAMALSLIHI